MAFIPFVMLLLTLIQYTAITEQDVMNLLLQIFPTSFQEYLRGLVEELYIRSTALISGTAIAAIWACARAVMAITNGLNSIHEIEETRNYLLRRLRSGVYVVILLMALVLSIVLLMFGNSVHDFLLDKVRILQRFSGLVAGGRMVLTLMILSGLIAMMYTFLPNQKQHFISQIPGAVIAAMSWSIFSSVVSVYLEWKGNFPSIYGGLTTVVMIMLWLYFCMWLLFFGALINVWLKEY